MGYGIKEEELSKEELRVGRELVLEFINSVGDNLQYMNRVDVLVGAHMFAILKLEDEQVSGKSILKLLQIVKSAVDKL